MLYQITFKDREILFVHTGMVGGVVAHYHILKEKPSSKFVELNKITAEFKLTDSIGNNNQCIYIPIVNLIHSTLLFPVDNLN